MKKVIVKFALALTLAMAACGADRGPDVLVVVQETNVPFASCGTAYEYTRTLPSPCNGLDLKVQICSEESLCQSQVDALVAPIASCEETRRYYQATSEQSC